jgi:hypothetical protein
MPKKKQPAVHDLDNFVALDMDDSEVLCEPTDLKQATECAIKGKNDKQENCIVVCQVILETELRTDVKPFGEV